MKYWKIKNVFNQAAKIVIATSPSTSVGVKLQPTQFVISAPKQTPAMDAQLRRKFITIEKDFDNDSYGFKLGVAYDESVYEAKKIELAEIKAMQYVNKSE